MDRDLRIILNPASGSGAGRRVLQRLESALTSRGISPRVQLTRGPGHATDLALAAREEGAKAVLVAGGDGTIHEVANGLLGRATAPALAVLPVGTGNDFHRMVGTDRSVGAALDLLTEGRAHPFDVGRAAWDGGSAHFVNVLGVGIDTEVLRNRDRFRRLKGLAQYAGAVLAAALHYRPFPLSVRVDDRDAFRDDTMLAAVSVGPSAGGGFKLSPDARPDDGRLDLLFVEALSVLQVVRYLPRVLRGTHRDAPVVRMHTLTRLRFESPDGAEFSFELDGELYPEPTGRLDVEVVPAALRVLRPREPEAR